MKRRNFNVMILLVFMILAIVIVELILPGLLLWTPFRNILNSNQLIGASALIYFAEILIFFILAFIEKDALIPAVNRIILPFCFILSFLLLSLLCYVYLGFYNAELLNRGDLLSTILSFLFSQVLFSIAATSPSPVWIVSTLLFVILYTQFQKKYADVIK